VEVREERELVVQQFVLVLERFLDLEQQLAAAPDGSRVGGNLGAGGLVLLVAEAGAMPGAALDDDRVPAPCELPRARGRQRHPALARLDLADDSHPDPARPPERRLTSSAWVRTSRSPTGRLMPPRPGTSSPGTPHPVGATLAAQA